MVSSAKVSQFLEGVNFPADKNQIIDYAEKYNAPRDVLDVLHRMPEDKYYSIAGVLESISRAA